MTPILSSAMVVVGAVVLTVAICKTRRILGRLQTTAVRTWWVALQALMVSFVAGYFGFIAMVGLGIDRLLLLLCGGIFLGGAAFVLLVVSAAERTIVELQATQTELAAAVIASTQKSHFLANMSHELRTPLNAVIGYSEMIEEELHGIGQTVLAADSHRVRQSAKHLLSLIDDALDLAKIEAGHLQLCVEAVDVDDLMREVAGAVKPAAERRKNALTVSVAPMGLMHTDGLRLRQCILNLASNACKFTEGGQIHLSAEREGQQVFFTVRDTGIGMTDAQLSRVFEAFQQADASTTRRFGGTGLGLTLTRQLATLLGGEVCAESRPGQGSVFKLSIPMLALTRRTPLATARAVATA